MLCLHPFLLWLLPKGEPMPEIWSDSNSIYLALPCRDGGVCNVAFPHTEAGLSRALRLLTPEPRPEQTSYDRNPSSKFTLEQRQAAAGVLRKLGAIG